MPSDRELNAIWCRTGTVRADGVDLDRLPPWQGHAETRGVASDSTQMHFTANSPRMQNNHQGDTACSPSSSTRAQCGPAYIVLYVAEGMPGGTAERVTISADQPNLVLIPSIRDDLVDGLHSGYHAYGSWPESPFALLYAAFGPGITELGAVGDRLAFDMFPTITGGAHVIGEDTKFAAAGRPGDRVGGCADDPGYDRPVGAAPALVRLPSDTWACWSYAIRHPSKSRYAEAPEGNRRYDGDNEQYNESGADDMRWIRAVPKKRLHGAFRLTRGAWTWS